MKPPLSTCWKEEGGPTFRLLFLPPVWCRPGGGEHQPLARKIRRRHTGHHPGTQLWAEHHQPPAAGPDPPCPGSRRCLFLPIPSSRPHWAYPFSRPSRKFPLLLSAPLRHPLLVREPVRSASTSEALRVQISFGGDLCLQTERLSDTTIYCSSPPHNEGVVAVEVGVGPPEGLVLAAEVSSRKHPSRGGPAVQTPSPPPPPRLSCLASPPPCNITTLRFPHLPPAGVLPVFPTASPAVFSAETSLCVRGDACGKAPEGLRGALRSVGHAPHEEPPRSSPHPPQVSTAPASPLAPWWALHAPSAFAFPAPSPSPSAMGPVSVSQRLRPPREV